MAARTQEMEMSMFQLTVKAAPAAGGNLSFHDYEAASADEAVADFWADVDAFGLMVSAVVEVQQVGD